MASGSSSSSTLLFGKRIEKGHMDQTVNIPQDVIVVPPAQPRIVPPKKRRNLPEIQYPDVEVVALSPTTLMAKNRFVCEVCHKGFPRDQNLELHKRGHNLPWKLKQTTTKADMKRKVYLCPEPTCLNHNPSHALGDFNGIKKHYSRKHSERKYKCQKCAKMYAVESDLKAHSKSCGTKKYQCHCGTLFSRRDIFILHRLFCKKQESGVEIIHPQTVSSMGLNSMKRSDNSNHPSQMMVSLPQMSSQVPSAQNVTSTSPTIAPGVYQLGRTSNNSLMIKPSLDLNCRKPSPDFFLPTTGTMAQFSATGLLRKAAAGGTLSDKGGLHFGSRHFGISNSRGHDNNVNELLHTFSKSTGVGSSIFNRYAGATYEQEDSFHGALDRGSKGYDDKWEAYNLEQQQQNTGSNMSFQRSSGVTLTRDFLGIGEELVNTSSDEPQSTFGRRSFL